MTIENIPVWTIPPDWQDGILESLEWLTSVLVSPTGREQRSDLRRTPRRSFEMTFKPRGPIRELFDLFLMRVGGAEIYAPLWKDVGKLQATASLGASALTVDVTDTEFGVSPLVYIQGSNPFDYELAEVGVVPDSLTINLVSPLARSWPAGTRVYPMSKFQIETQPQAARKADRTYQARVRFSSTTPNPWGGWLSSDEDVVLTTDDEVRLTPDVSLLVSEDVAPDEYFGVQVLTTVPNDVQDLTYTYQRLFAELDNQTGRRARIDTSGKGFPSQQFTWWAKDKAKQASHRSLFYHLAGRKNLIWVPTFFADLDFVAIDGDAIVVKRCGFTDFGGPLAGRKHIVIQREGSKDYREILSSALVGDGTTERIALSSAISPGTVGRISFITLKRLDQDTIEILHHTDRVATATTVFRSVGEDAIPCYLLSDADEKLLSDTNDGLEPDSCFPDGDDDDGDDDDDTPFVLMEGFGEVLDEEGVPVAV